MPSLVGWQKRVTISLLSLSVVRQKTLMTVCASDSEAIAEAAAAVARHGGGVLGPLRAGFDIVERHVDLPRRQG